MLFPIKLKPSFFLILPASESCHFLWPFLSGRKRRTAETAAMECGISSALRGFGDIFGTWADDHVLHRHAGLVWSAHVKGNSSSAR